MKKLAGLLASCMLIGSIIAPVGVSANNDTVVIGDKLVFDEGSGPIIVNDRVMIPLRAVAEALDATVYWFNDDKRIQIVLYDSLLSLQIDNNMMGKYIIKDGKAVIDENIEMDVAAMIQNDRTYVPLRAISEAFDAGISWDNPNRTALVIPKKITPNQLSLQEIADQPEGTLCSALGVISRDSASGTFYLRSLQMNSNGDYDRIPFCTPTKTSISQDTGYGEYISAYWMEQFKTENPSGIVVSFTGVTHTEDGLTYLVINKTSTGIRSLGNYDEYMKSLGLYYTPFDNMRS